MGSAGEVLQLNDCFLVKLDLEDSPSAEVPLSEIYDLVTSTLHDNYREAIRKSILQILEDTMWINDTMLDEFQNANFGIFDVRTDGTVVSLRAAGLQRLATQAIANRGLPIVALQIPLLIRFKSPDKPLPTSSQASTPSVPVRTGPPSNVSEAELLDQVSELPGISPVFQQPIRTTMDGSTSAPGIEDPTIDLVSPPETTTFRSTAPGPVPGTSTADYRDSASSSMPDPAAPTFRGNPINIERRPNMTGSTGATSRGRGYEALDGRISGNATSTRRGLLFDHTAERTPLMRTPTRSHPYSDEVSFGAETFQDYMSQFQFSEVKYKDFRKVTIPKFDASKNDSFVHWYKFLVSTCLQWGVWCPPYESIEEDNVYGSWWNSLPQSVRDQKSFMGHLLYSLLIKPETFPSNSRELEAVEGSTANAGYNAIYNILRMHHPILHSVYSTANEIPRHRRSETFSLYLRRLQEFIARERLATRTYTESEALDLAVRNLSAEWRSDFRRLVERDKFSGKGGMLPFKLALPQIATTFVEYADEIGREAPGSRLATTHPRPAPTAVIRRLEATNDATGLDGAYLPEEEVDLIVNAIAHNQQSSAVCLGCQMSGHTLTECNRFVDYIVAESLAQRHPALRMQVANSHSHFRTRLNAANARTRLVSPANSTSRTIRSLHIGDPSADESSSGVVETEEDDTGDEGYRQHAIHISDDDPNDDFEGCFSSLSIHSVQILGVEEINSTTMASIIAPSESADVLDPLSVRRLAATYDVPTASTYAHADNGSMACTVNDKNLLFAYRPLNNTSVRLFDAGNHVHRPLGVGFLCVPTENRGTGGASSFVFVRTYHTPTIPGVIISHSAISRQLNTSSYHTSSHLDLAGFIHFPHRLRRNQDVYVSIQPISKRGGLTFTEALILPNDEQHLAAIPPWPTRVHRLCSDHAPDTSTPQVIDPTDGMTCQACHEPPPVVSNGASCHTCRDQHLKPDFR